MLHEQILIALGGPNIETIRFETSIFSTSG